MISKICALFNLKLFTQSIRFLFPQTRAQTQAFYQSAIYDCQRWCGEIPQAIRQTHGSSGCSRAEITQVRNTGSEERPAGPCARGGSVIILGETTGCDKADVVMRASMSHRARSCIRQNHKGAKVYFLRRRLAMQKRDGVSETPKSFSVLRRAAFPPACFF